MDARSGLWVNCSLGNALVPTNAHVADIEALVIEKDDTRGHPLGIKDMSEIGSIGDQPRSARPSSTPPACA